MEDFYIVLGELFGLVDFVYYLSDAYYFAFVIKNRHTQYQISFVARFVVDFAVETRVLKIKNTFFMSTIKLLLLHSVIHMKYTPIRKLNAKLQAVALLYICQRNDF